MTDLYKKITNKPTNNFIEVMEFLIKEYKIFIKIYEIEEYKLNDFGYEIINSETKSVISSYSNLNTYSLAVERALKHVISLINIKKINDDYIKIISKIKDGEVIKFDDWSMSKFSVRSYDKSEHILDKEHIIGVSNKGIHILFSDEPIQLNNLVYLEDRKIVLNKITNKYLKNECIKESEERKRQHYQQIIESAPEI